jgi:hypothetical protein
MVAFFLKLRRRACRSGLCLHIMLTDSAFAASSRFLRIQKSFRMKTCRFQNDSILTFAFTRPPATDLVEEARKRLIVALDVPDAASATELVDQLDRDLPMVQGGPGAVCRRRPGRY